MANTPNIDLDRLIEGQVQGEVTYNEAINKLDSHVHMAIESRTLTAPPGGESNGDRYLLPGSGCSGAWATHDGELAFFYDGWRFNDPKEGYTLWSKPEDIFLLYDGSVWIDFIQSAGMQNPVLDKDLTTPPGVPSVGDRYIVGPSATGAWSGEDDNITEWNGAAWTFTTATDGMTVFITDEDEIYAYQTSAWVQKTGAAGPGTTRYDAVIRRSDYASDVLAGAALKTALENASLESIAVEGGTFESTATITQAANQMVDCDPEVVVKLTGSGIHLIVGAECCLHEGTVDGNSSGGGGAAPALVDLSSRSSRLERVRIINSAGVGVYGGNGGATTFDRGQLDGCRASGNTASGFYAVFGIDSCYAYNNGVYGFRSCERLSNVVARQNTSDGYFTCDQIANARAYNNGSNGFATCSDLTNVYATSNLADGFQSCERVENAEAVNNAVYGFDACLALSGWSGSGNSSGTFNLGTCTTKMECQEINTSVDVGGTSWSVSTGVLGFIPVYVEVKWRARASIGGTEELVGYGSARGIAAGDQSGIEWHWATGSADFRSAWDANDIMGFVAAGGNAFAERARVTQFDSNGVVITTQTGQWNISSNTIDVSIIVYGGR